MRVLLAKESKIRLLEYLKKVNNCNSITSLSKKLKISKDWFYKEHRYMPENVIPKELINKLKIIDKKSDKWGQIKGGKISLSKRNDVSEKKFRIDINNPLFLEFYGTLLGDGWLSHLLYNYKEKRSLWWVGISGHAKLDRSHLIFIKEIIIKLFDRKVTTKINEASNSMELIFCHRPLILFMNKEFKFPIGKKINLIIKEDILNNWNKIKYVIRGIFDTDGCFYLDKTPVGNDYA